MLEVARHKSGFSFRVGFRNPRCATHALRDTSHFQYLCNPKLAHFPIFISVAMSMVEIRVPNLDCHGCASKIKRTLFKLKGVEEIEIEMEMQKIVVKGYGLDERKVLKAIKRAGKAAEPWPYPGYSSHFASFYKYPTHIANQYYYDRNEATGHNLHTFFHTPSVYSVAIASDEAVASLFSDENPHACAIM